jgi:hypothetical protein
VDTKAAGWDLVLVPTTQAVVMSTMKVLGFKFCLDLEKEFRDSELVTCNDLKCKHARTCAIFKSTSRATT